MQWSRVLGFSVFVLVPSVAALDGCSSGTTTTGGATLACKQKADSDTDDDCSGKVGYPRKLDCDSSQTDAALMAGCVRQKDGDNDVCCPLSITGTPPGSTSGNQLACRQGADADLNDDCAGQAGKPRQLDCDDSDVSAALAAGCVQPKPGKTDVCCPTTVSGTPVTSTNDAGITPATAQAIVEITLGGTAAGCGSDVFDVGSFSPDTPVKNGDSVNGVTTSVVCSVMSSSGSFNVNADVKLGAGSRFHLNGTASTNASSSSLSGIFTDATGTAYPRSGCVTTYPSLGGVASGRLWAMFVCPANGTGIPGACTITTQIKLENCTQ